MEAAHCSTSTPTAAEEQTIDTNPLKNYFEYGKETKKCNCCKTVISSKTGTTTAALSHLKRKHGDLFIKYNKEKEIWEKSKKSKLTYRTIQEKLEKPSQTIKEAFQKQNKWSADSAQALAVTGKVCRFLVSGLHPYSVVEEQGFKDLMDSVCPNYKIPSRTTFSRTIVPNMCDKIKLQIQTEIDNVEIESFSFTTDGWSSRKRDSYISLTSHYINPQFELRSFWLGLRELPDKHTAIHVYRAINEMFNDWKINTKFEKVPMYAVTDNAPNMKSAVSSSCSRWYHIACFGHTLQLALEDSIKEVVSISNLLSKSRTIVGHYAKSPAATARLHAEQRQLQEQELELIQDVPTRWNSQLAMLERLIKCRRAISFELSSSDSSIQNLKGSEWKTAEEVVKVLKPLLQATVYSSGATYPTLSAVLPMLHGIDLQLSTLAEKEQIHFATVVKKNLHSRFMPLSLDPNYLLSTLVDPRFKIQGLKPELKTPASTLLCQEIRKYDNKPVQSTSGTTGQEPEDSIFNYMDLPDETEESDDDEIKSYLKMPRIPKNDNALDWWQRHAEFFPRISKMARKYLGIPATSVPSERLFSTAGNVVAARRKELLPQHVEQLVLLHNNLKLKFSSN